MEGVEGLAASIKGRVEGVAEVRDKHGNLKGTFTFGGDATKEQMDAMKDANPDAKISTNLGDSHGSDTSHGGA